ncbi:MAG: xanthine dehydrogenase family protein molybdopterin-binding subunit [Deltaproteobacteria bacterium]|nr:xanthine dehydrogenase family protein molybdopterin-binding subunit [Deltaproteobacteria bacterium]
MSEAPRVDAWDKVTGRAVYTEDIHIPGTVFARLLRSPYAHARIRSINSARAERLAGVLTVLTRDSLGGLNPYISRERPGQPKGGDQPVIAVEKVRYEGEPVAAVVAEELATAHQALEQIEVEYEELPTVCDAHEALAPGAPLVHEARGTNLVGEYRFGWGDPEQAFLKADHIFEDSYTFPNVYHFPLENAGICHAEVKDDEVTLWAPHQRPFDTREVVARLVGSSPEKVRVRVPYVGGGFGCKDLGTSELIAVILARQVGRAVKMVPSMEESFHTNARHLIVYRIKTGVNSDGTILAQDIELLVETGAYMTSGAWVTRLAVGGAVGPYRVPHVRIVGRCIYTNKVPAGAFRGFSKPQVTWGFESNIDTIARSLGIDPLDFRLRNLLRRGEQVVPGALPLDTDYADLLRRATSLIGWDGRSQPKKAGASNGGTFSQPGQGRGLAVTLRHGGTNSNAAYAIATMDRHGQVRILHNASEIGQGTYTVISRVAARILGVEEDKISVGHPDTTIAPYYYGTSSSRNTVAMGMAVQRAMEDLKRELLDLAAKVRGGRPEEWRLAEGRLWHGSESCSIAEMLSSAGGILNVIGKGSYSTSLSDTPWACVNPYWEVSVSAAEVQVDTDTGQVHVLKYATVADVGRALHPPACKGQLEGGAIMGIGHTLLEQIIYRDGQLVSASPFYYRVPLLSHLPEEFQCGMVENGDGPGPFGSKGVGQATISPVAPAISNAIYEAIGVRIKHLPVTEEKILRALGRL